MEKKEFKIGESFQYGLVKLKCVKAKNEKDACDGCIFKSHDCLDYKVFAGRCQSYLREDKTDVIFVEVKDKE